MREDILTTKLEKLARLKTAFGTAYPETALRTKEISAFLAAFDVVTDTERVSIVGRVKSLRVMGKIAFAHIEDGTGKIQIFCSNSVGKMSENSFRLFKEHIEIGDFV